MYALIGLGFLAFVFCFILTPLIRNLALKLGLVDLPDARKIHVKPVPRIGGVAIVLSYAAAIGLMVRFAPKGASIAIQHRDLVLSLFPAVTLIFLIGLIDDLLHLRAWQKLAGQILAAILAVSMGARIPLLSGHDSTGWIMWLLSVGWLVGCTNAFNLIDGLDGLAPGVGLFATLTTLLAAILQGNTGLAMATVPLAGCLVAFLRYNFNPASVFLGDSGSLTIGFLLGCFAVIWSQKSATLLGMIAPLMAFSLPLFEVGLSICRRFLRNQPIFQPDRGHIHHRLLGFGLHPRAVALILYAACGVAAVLSLLQSSLSFHVGGLIIIVFCSLALIGIRRLGYVEFRTAGEVIRKGRILQMVQSEINLEVFRSAISATRTPRECWRVIRDTCDEMGFAKLRVVIGNQEFSQTFREVPSEYAWEFSVTFQGDYQIVLTRGGNDHLPVLTSFLKALQESINAKHFAGELRFAEVFSSLDGPDPVHHQQQEESVAACAI
jgi:UDP-GlcNAc:undecaprenyl-phosphate/decaprenyl-phosphate GlcNAc-1-phosphate transferase